MHQGAFGNAPGAVERLVADEAAAAADRQRQRVEHGADLGLGSGRYLDVAPGTRVGVVHTQSEDHLLLRSRARSTPPSGDITADASITPFAKSAGIVGKCTRLVFTNASGREAGRWRGPACRPTAWLGRRVQRGI